MKKPRFNRFFLEEYPNRYPTLIQHNPDYKEDMEKLRDHDWTHLEEEDEEDIDGTQTDWTRWNEDAVKIVDHMFDLLENLHQDERRNGIRWYIDTTSATTSNCSGQQADD